MTPITHKFHNPFPHIIVENIYHEEELKLIWEELNFLTKPHKFIKNDLSTDRDEQNKPKSKSKIIILDNIYTDRSISNILTVNRKLFYEDYLKEFYSISPQCKSILHQNHDTTAIRYYENDDEYLPHVDLYNYTAITFFYKTPKSFEGGNLVFPEYDYSVECKNNLMILFPSCIIHAATKIKMHDNTFLSGKGRYAMMQFIKLV